MAKRALLVGCNYPGTKVELHGCANDVKRMYATLTSRFGFDEADILVLLDTDPSGMQPTGENIRSCLAKLVRGTEPGDVLVFHYSGHGTQVPQEAGGDVDETGAEEAIVPTDMNLLTDDDFRDLVNKIPGGATFTFLSDSCHSGGLIDAAKEQIGDSSGGGGGLMGLMSQGLGLQTRDFDFSGGGRRRDEEEYGEREEGYERRGRRPDGDEEEEGYGRRPGEEEEYGRRRRHEEEGYGGGEAEQFSEEIGGRRGRREEYEGYGRGSEEEQYAAGLGGGRRRQEENEGYGRGSEEEQYAAGLGGGRRRQEENEGYGRGSEEEQYAAGLGGGRRRQEENEGYGRGSEEEQYAAGLGGGRRRQEENEGYGRGSEEEQYAAGLGGGRRRQEENEGYGRGSEEEQYAAGLGGGGRRRGEERYGGEAEQYSQEIGGGNGVTSKEIPVDMLTEILSERTGHKVDIGNIRTTLFDMFGDQASPTVKMFANLVVQQLQGGGQGGWMGAVSSLATQFFQGKLDGQDPDQAASYLAPAQNAGDYRPRPQRRSQRAVDVGILLSGCQSNETSADANPSNDPADSYGAFSNAIQTVLSKTDGAISNRELILQVRKVLQSQGFKQHPCLYCSDENADGPFICN